MSNLQKKLFALITLIFLFSLTVQAQGERKVIRFSGLVVEGDSIGVPGVNIYIPGTGRGTSTNSLGYFSMNTRVGDTIRISSLTHQNRTIYIPKQLEEPAYSILVNLEADTMLLQEVEVFPYPTIDYFKEAFLALDVSDPKYEYMRRNLDKQMLAEAVAELPMSAGSNFRYFSQMRVNAQANRYFAPSIPLLNPFAWAQLIKSIKKGDFKRQFKKNKKKREERQDERDKN
jgi:hypothetical protein